MVVEEADIVTGDKRIKEEREKRGRWGRNMSIF